MRVSLTDMRVFLAVVEAGSLTQGASAIHLSLASVSERISGMERMLGTPLLVRTRRGAEPTAAGEVLLSHAREILARSELLSAELSAYGSGAKTRIRLISTSAAAAFLPDQLCRFLVKHPGVSIDFQERTTFEIVQAVSAGRADLGIVADTSDLGRLQTDLISTDQLVVATSHHHPLAQMSAVDFPAVLRYPIVGLSEAALEMYG